MKGRFRPFLRIAAHPFFVTSVGFLSGVRPMRCFPVLSSYGKGLTLPLAKMKKCEVIMIQIAPSLLACDFAEMGAAVRAVDAAGADALHLDVMDGLFVPNISFGLPVVEALRPHTALPFDVHLMIVDPERYIERFATAGADWITVHFEACREPAAVLAAIRAHGCRAGLSIKPGTAPEEIFPLLSLCDMVLVMTVEPGFGGQSLIPSCLEKIPVLKAEISRQGLSVPIEVDGGVNGKTVAAVRAAGADILVAGSSVFGADDKAAAISLLRGE